MKTLCIICLMMAWATGACSQGDAVRNPNRAKVKILLPDMVSGNSQLRPARVLNAEEVAAEIMYPDEARIQKQEAKVQCNVLVDANGDYVDYRIIRSAGEALDQAVINRIHKLRFEAAMVDGTYVPQWYPIVIRFRLYK